MIVAPINKIEKYSEQILEFKGLNHQSVIDDGEMSDMKNLCSEMYPCLYPRRKRTIQDLDDFVYYSGTTYGTDEQETPDTTTGDYDRVHEVIIKRDFSNNKTDEIAAIVFGCRNLVGSAEESILETRFYYRGNRYKSVEAKFSGLTKAELESLYMVAINSKICIFPIGIYFDTGVTDAEATSGKSRCGSLNYSYVGTSTNAVEVNIADGYMNIRIGEANFGNLKPDDVVIVEGTFTFRREYTPGGGLEGSTDADTKTIIYKSGASDTDKEKEAAYPVLYGFCRGSMSSGTTANYLQLQLSAFDYDETYQYADVTGLKITRKTPELDFVVEHDNRLWGCSNKTNTIYACKLGDPLNWEYYQGTGMDSYYAEQGSNGDWTGISCYNNHLLFFKETSIVKLYGTTPSTYQTSTIKAPGVEKGSSRSIAILDSGMVVYNSPEGIMAYEGEYPYVISKKLCRDKLVDIVAGGYYNKYYMYVNGSNADVLAESVYVLDVDNAVWHKEDSFVATEFFMFNSDMYAVGTESVRGVHTSNIFDKVFAIEADRDRSTIEWYAILGPFTEFLEDHKIYSKIDMRIKKSAEASLQFYIKMDEGDWEALTEGSSSTNLCYHQTFVPRRCHEFSVKISGTGDVRIDSLRRKYRKGTEGDL